MNKYFLFILTLLALQLNASELKSKLRPDIVDALATHADYKSEDNIPAVNGRFNPPQFLESIKLDAPKLIAQVEAAYPGATFVFMGRDTQLLAEVFDAFYLSIGQPKRIIKLGVSKPTLAELSHADTIKYLEYFGLNLNKIKSDSKPYILIDTVSSGEVIEGALISGRQGRNLLQIIYSEWIRLGNNPKKLLSKVNMIGLLVSTFRSSDISNKKRFKSIEGLKEINKENETVLKSDVAKIGRDFIIGSIEDTPNLINEAGYDHYTGAWHDKFQKPVLKKGLLIPSPGKQMDLSQRKSIVWMQHKLIDLIRNYDFIKRTLVEGKNLDVEFNSAFLCQAIYE